MVKYSRKRKASVARSTRKYKPKSSSYVKYRRGKAKRAPRSRVPRYSPLLGLSQCARDYMKVLVNPFEPGVSGAPCIPDYRAIPSAKFYLRVRGSMTVSKSGTTAGLGFVIFNPFRPNTIVGASGGPAIMRTTGIDGSALSTVTGAAATTYVDWKYFDTTLQYADFATDGSKNKFRVVGAGLRIQYTGQSDDRQGQYILWRHPSNQRTALTAGLTAAELLQYEDTVYQAVDTGIHQVIYKPVDNDDFEYGVQNSSSALDCGVMAAVVEGAAVGSTFLYEAIAWYEAIGPTMRGESPSHVDLSGLGQAISLSNMLKSNGIKRPFSKGNFSLGKKK